MTGVNLPPPPPQTKFIYRGGWGGLYLPHLYGRWGALPPIFQSRAGFDCFYTGGRVPPLMVLPPDYLRLMGTF